MPSESKLEKDIVKMAKAMGLLSFKFVSPNCRGVPDRLFLSDPGFLDEAGFTLFMEVKAPKKKPTPVQFYVLKKLQDHGTPVCWVNDLEDAKVKLVCFLNSPNSFNKRYPIE